MKGINRPGSYYLASEDNDHKIAQINKGPNKNRRSTSKRS